MEAALRPDRGGTVLAPGILGFKRRIALSLLLSLLPVSCYLDQPRPWQEEPKPWDAKAVAKTYRVRAREADGQEITLFRAAIIEEDGRQVLVGRVWDPRANFDSTASVDLSRVDRLETQRMGTELVGTSVSHILGACCTVLAVVLIVSWF